MAGTDAGALDGYESSGRSLDGPVINKKGLRVLQVYVDEAGGGPANVKLLHRAIGARVDWHEVGITLPEARGWRTGAARNLVQDAVERWDAQVVHAHGIRAASLVAAARVDAKSAVTVHGLHAVRRSRGVARVLAEKVSARVLRSLDIVFCTGRSDLDTVRRWGIERSTELRWIHSAFTKPPRHDRAEARARLGIPLSSEMVLWMGRFEHQKNPQLLLRAAERLKDRTGLALVMAGDGPLHAEVAGAVKGSALEDVVMLPGWIDDPSWAFAAADVYVSTARWEGFPLTCLEAASSGLPMVITDSPGNRDLVEVGLDVMPVAQDDPRRVADAIALALETRPADMGRRNAVLKDFSIEVLGEEVLAGYEDVLGPDPV